MGGGYQCPLRGRGGRGQLPICHDRLEYLHLELAPAVRLRTRTGYRAPHSLNLRHVGAVARILPGILHVLPHLRPYQRNRPCSATASAAAFYPQ